MMKVYSPTKNITFIHFPSEESTKLYLIIGSGRVRQLTLPRAGKVLHSLQRKVSKLDPRPQYYWRSESDCDHMHVEYAERFPNAWTAEKRMQDAWDNREGALHFDKLTREEYYEYRAEATSEDRAAQDAGY